MMRFLRVLSVFVALVLCLYGEDSLLKDIGDDLIPSLQRHKLEKSWFCSDELISLVNKNYTKFQPLSSDSADPFYNAKERNFYTQFVWVLGRLSQFDIQFRENCAPFLENTLNGTYYSHLQRIEATPSQWNTILYGAGALGFSLLTQNKRTMALPSPSDFSKQIGSSFHLNTFDDLFYSKLSMAAFAMENTLGYPGLNDFKKYMQGLKSTPAPYQQIIDRYPWERQLVTEEEAQKFWRSFISEHHAYKKLEAKQKIDLVLQFESDENVWRFECYDGDVNIGFIRVEEYKDFTEDHHECPLYIGNVNFAGHQKKGYGPLFLSIITQFFDQPILHINRSYLLVSSLVSGAGRAYAIAGFRLFSKTRQFIKDYYGLKTLETAEAKWFYNQREYYDALNSSQGYQNHMIRRRFDWGVDLSSLKTPWGDVIRQRTEQEITEILDTLDKRTYGAWSDLWGGR